MRIYVVYRVGNWIVIYIYIYVRIKFKKNCYAYVMVSYVIFEYIIHNYKVSLLKYGYTTIFQICNPNFFW